MWPRIKSLSGTGEDHKYCSEKNFQIKPKRPVLDVIQIHRDPFVEVSYFVSSVDLPETSNAGLHQHFSFLIFSKARVFDCQGRTRPDHTHIPLEYAVELGQLVEAVLAHPGAEPSDAGIIGDLEHWSAHF